MKISVKCGECGELLNASAGEMKSSEFIIYLDEDHECRNEEKKQMQEYVEELEAETETAAKRPWDAWPQPAQEITPEGLDGTAVLNTCMLCGTEATHTGRDRIGQDSFKCSADGCGAEFEETGTGAELLPCGFGEGFEYSAKLDNGELLEFIVLFPGDTESMVIKSNKGGATVHVTKDGDSEFFIVPEGIGGQGEKVYPYCQKA